MITPDSAFDKWLRGDENALTAQQKHGYQLFKENKCATCHGGIILGGRSFEPLGLKRDFNFGEITAADIGRMNVTKEVRDKLRQKSWLTQRRVNSALFPSGRRTDAGWSGKTDAALSGWHRSAAKRY